MLFHEQKQCTNGINDRVLRETKSTMVMHGREEMLFEFIIWSYVSYIVETVGLNVRVADSNLKGGILFAPVKKGRTSNSTTSISPPNE